MIAFFTFLVAFINQLAYLYVSPLLNSLSHIFMRESNSTIFIKDIVNNDSTGKNKGP